MTTKLKRPHETSVRSLDWLRPLRYLVRTPLLLLHILLALPLAVLVINPLVSRIKIRHERIDHWMTRWWSRTLLRLFGFTIRRYGEPLPGSVLVVANHLSWLDIELLHSQRMLCFIAKSEIARWPLVGWLASRAGTIYHKRGNTHSLTSVIETAVTRLKQGFAVGVFPEGGTGPGDRVRTFHARIFQIARDASVPIQPVALRYGRHGTQDLSLTFAPGESFFSNFLRVLGGPSLEAELHFLPPVKVVDDEGRRRAAEAAREMIVKALGYHEGET